MASIEMYFKPVFGELAAFEGDFRPQHGFIIYRNDNGDIVGYLRGGPSSKVNGSSQDNTGGSGNAFGYVYSMSGTEYNSNENPDYLSNINSLPRQTLFEGSESEMYRNFNRDQSLAESISRSNIPYYFMNQNSNSFANTIARVNYGQDLNETKNYWAPAFENNLSNQIRSAEELSRINVENGVIYDQSQSYAASTFSVSPFDAFLKPGGQQLDLGTSQFPSSVTSMPYNSFSSLDANGAAFGSLPNPSVFSAGAPMPVKSELGAGGTLTGSSIPNFSTGAFDGTNQWGSLTNQYNANEYAAIGNALNAGVAAALRPGIDGIGTAKSLETDQTSNSIPVDNLSRPNNAAPDYFAQTPGAGDYYAVAQDWYLQDGFGSPNNYAGYDPAGPSAVYGNPSYGYGDPSYSYGYYDPGYSYGYTDPGYSWGSGGWDWGWGSSGWDWGYPVVLDLNGDGIKITPQSQSNQFYDMAGDGYQHKTAWAAAGDGVLVFDTNNDGKITQHNQVVFTDWDSSATSDMQALRDVFDTNHNGKLDAGDAQFAKFKIMVTNADGTTGLQTLAQAGITAINLIPDASKTVLSDGSAINGQSTFTRTDGSTGAAGDVSLSYDYKGYAIKQTITHNADGSTTIDNKAVNPDGGLANETIGVTSADGRTRIVSFDGNGDGVIDRIQTSVTVLNANGTTTETLTNKTGAGRLTDQSVTATSADGNTITILRDANGDGLNDQQEVRTTNADGSRSIALSDLNPDGSIKDKTTTATSIDGLTRTITSDIDGNNFADLTQVDTTVVAGNDTRTQDVTTRNTDGSLRNATHIVISADGSSRTVSSDLNGDGVTDLTTVTSVTLNADGSSLQSITEKNGDQSFRDQTLTSVAANGLDTTTWSYLSNAATYDHKTVKQTTVDAAGNQTDYTFDFSPGSAILIIQSVIVKSVDGRSRTITLSSDHGTGLVMDQRETIILDASGNSTDTLTNFNIDGSKVNQSVTLTSADGLTRSVKTDINGDGVFDRIMNSVTVKNTDGSATVTHSDLNANGALIDKTVTTTSTSGLSVTIQNDANGDGVFDSVTTDNIVLNADGSKTETVMMASTSGTLLAKSIVATSIDRRTVTTTRDLNGDGLVDQAETIVQAANGTVTDTVSNFNPDGSLRDKSAVSANATGLSKTTQVDINGDGVFDLTSVDNTVLNADGSRTETVTQTNANGSLRAKTVVTINATGLAVTTQQDLDGNGTIDATATDITVLNADGSRIETLTNKSANGAIINASVVTNSANGLSKTSQSDLNGDGTIDRTRTDIVVLNANGSRVETVSEFNGNSGALRDKVVTTTSADGRTMSVTRDTNGDAHIDQTETLATMINGNVVDTVSNFNPDGSLRDRTITTSGANGLTKTVQTDVNGDGIVDLTHAEATVVNADGSTGVTATDKSGTVLRDTYIVVTSADGRIKTTTRDTNGDGTTDLKNVDTLVVNADGSTVETVSASNSNNALRDKTVTTTSADRKTISISRDINGDTLVDQTETIAVQANGNTIDTITGLNSSGSATDRRIITTAANGLSSSLQIDSNADGNIDETLSDAVILNADGSRTETLTNYNGTVTGSIKAQSVITTSANGLSKTTQRTGTNGQNNSLPVTITDVTVINAYGSTTQTVSDLTPANVLRDKSVTTVSANGLSKTIQIDVDGNGTFDSTDTLVSNVDGSSVDTLTALNPNGTLKQTDVLATSADGLTQSLQRDTNGDGIFDHFETTSINPDGSTKDIISDTNSSGVLLDKITTTTSANGLSKTIQMDINGDGAIDTTQAVTTALNADGSRVAMLSDFNGSGTLRDRTITTMSANGLTRTSSIDTNGDGIVDETQSDNTVLNTDGSKVRTIADFYSDGALKDKTVTTIRADGLVITTNIDTNGDGSNERGQVVKTGADGSRSDTTTFYNTNGSTKSSVTTSTSFDGRVTAMQRNNGIAETTVVVPDSNGSYSWTQTAPANDPFVLAPTIISQYAEHTIDANNIDTWIWNENPTSYVSGVAYGVTYRIPYYDSGRNHTITIDLATESKDLDIAKRLYDTAFDRDMSSTETQFLAKYITSGSGALDTGTLATALMATAEFSQKYGSLSNVQFVERVFQNALGRSATLSELSNYVGALNSATLTKGAILIAISETAEHIATGNVHFVTNNTATGDPSFTADHTTDKKIAADIVARLFDVVFDRDATASEISTQVPRITTGSATELQVATDLINLAEFSSKYGTLSNSNFVSQIFFNSLSRAPTTAELQFWLAALNANTVSRAELVDALAQSPDHFAVGNVHPPSVTVTTTGASVSANWKQILFDVGSSGTVTGNNNTITMKNAANVTVVGTDTLNVIGSATIATMSSGTANVAGGAALTLTGNSDTVAINGAGNLTLTGRAETVNANGAGALIDIKGGQITTVTTQGGMLGQTITTTTNESNTVNASNATIIVEDTSLITINGNNNTITQKSNDNVTVNGTGNTLNVAGTSDIAAISSSTVNIASGSGLTLTGNNDTITVGANSNVTISGSNDTFVFHPNFGKDTITGFNSTDAMRFDSAVFADWAHLLAKTSQSGADTIITLDAADTITLKGVTASNLNQSQFQFV